MALTKGYKAPQFTLENTEGDEVSITDYRGQTVLLLFFPLAFSSVCTKELCTTRDNMKLYEAFNTEVVAVSVDSFFTLKEFKKSQNLNFTLLSDFNKEVSREYDVLYEDYFGMKGVAKRAAFLIDQGGTIQHSQVLDDSGKLPDFDAILDVLKNLSTKY
ncbi:redoxin domain-containing protein [Aliifodinibius sp. S!AR15-10]|uniref:redoxin domain-containing protein n=1 Tax=Aliifodinibius sp. S!AR15-10 TaxID=2950437 RepID=UPI0028585D74|nr:redoxin domain-containing protein [Aliifodinibius sp. S!AR15-10]MDR8394262.1 redoxin domain-containing protein [Aliifodinibius sp. S!AR15-10]